MSRDIFSSDYNPDEGKLINFNEVYGLIDIYGQGIQKYYGNDKFETVENPGDWENCPNCGLKPIVWVFDNGNLTACGCGENNVNYFSVEAENIEKLMRIHHGNLHYYDADKLRKNWNFYCKTGLVPELNYYEIYTRTVFLVREIEVRGFDLEESLEYSSINLFQNIYQTECKSDEVDLEDAFDKNISMPCNINELDLYKDGNNKYFDIIDMIHFNFNGKVYNKAIKIYKNTDLSFLQSLEKSMTREEISEILKSMI